jgi:hypothetical protein
MLLVSWRTSWATYAAVHVHSKFYVHHHDATYLSTDRLKILLLFACSQRFKLLDTRLTTSCSLLLALLALHALQTTSMRRRSRHPNSFNTLCMMGANWCHGTASSSLG